MSDTSLDILLLVCDRKEGEVAVLLSDEGDETKVFPPLSDPLCEGGVYRCAFRNGVLLSAERDEVEEAKRREASDALLKALFGNK